MHMPSRWWLLVVCMQAELVCFISGSSPVTLGGETEVGQVKQPAWLADQRSPLRQRFFKIVACRCLKCMQEFLGKPVNHVGSCYTCRQARCQRSGKKQRNRQSDATNLTLRLLRHPSGPRR